MQLFEKKIVRASRNEEKKLKIAMPQNFASIILKWEKEEKKYFLSTTAETRCNKITIIYWPRAELRNYYFHELASGYTFLYVNKYVCVLVLLMLRM